MRPVNLIPAEERRGERTPLRGGPAAYVVVGALVAALAGVTVLVLTDNQISDRKERAAELRAEDAAARATAQRLSAYSSFGQVRDQRLATVTSLADSRFDWERVMRELALILPDDVWLTNLTGKANPQVAIEGEANLALRGSIPGPALEMVGCATGQDAVARFVSALRDVDGVTRVGVQASQLSDSPVTTGGGASGGTVNTSDCRTRNFIAQFEIVAAFDAAPTATSTAGTGTAPVTPVPTAPAPSATPTSSPGG
ncbi:MAG: PilN domain-containing protein [Solirubrobacterales bacterium]